jgi:Sec-independent protein secretion pathway component TatC
VQQQSAAGVAQIPRIVREAGVMSNTGTRISTLWIVVMFNMIFADILAFEIPGFMQKLWAGEMGVQITPAVLLVFAVLLEIPIAMIFLSRILKPVANRWANTVAAVVTAAFVVGGGTTYPHALFFATVEVACLALIVWSVWARRSSEAAVATGGQVALEV